MSATLETKGPGTKSADLVLVAAPDSPCSFTTSAPSAITGVECSLEGTQRLFEKDVTSPGNGSTPMYGLSRSRERRGAVNHAIE